jgi:hypothetical protein
MIMDSKTTTKNDSWSTRLLIPPATMTAGFVVAIALDDAIWTITPLMLAMLACALFGAVWTCVDLLRGQIKTATTVALGVAMLVLAPEAAQSISPAIRNLSYRMQIPTYDDVVARERRERPGQQIRMVVTYDDRSGFVTSAPIFEYVVYDDSDALAVSPDSLVGYWRYPESETGKINVSGGRHQIWNLGRHYYRVITTL